MIEPSVGFEYPADEPDTEAVRMSARGEAWRLLLDILAAAPNPAVRIAALRYLGNPKERNISETARELGVSRMTLHRELKEMRTYAFLSRVTPHLRG